MMRASLGRVMALASAVGAIAAAAAPRASARKTYYHPGEKPRPQSTGGRFSGSGKIAVQTRQLRRAAERAAGKTSAKKAR